ncbi:hypothetical protein [Dyadobacter sp. Leaf189]|uniref:hypothetical protein n=1 Tax=Dyadobacter sp. Leaf189 TaxID=1736295 RepID=UPI0006FF6315|nr:hypothetical protein [Dyadobacter sp. Leaf189]KQS27047.1 hypothetical protein ASG33_21170 [Dyadobacter sp. Leaf189]
MTTTLPPPFTLEKRLIWLYFILIILEGALRKWVFPSLSTPLLVIREPVALALILTSVRNGIFPLNPFLYGMILIGIAGFFAAIFAGHGSMAVAIFGCRVFLLHFPIIFIMGAVLTREDVINMGKVTLSMAIPMAVLLVIQFYSPQSAWVNRGVGGDMLGAGFSGAMGYYRPPGTFSFTIGTTLFFGFATCFVFYFWLNPMYIRKSVLWLSTAALIVAIPVSISRGLFFQVGVVMLFAIIASATSLKNTVKILSSLLIVALLVGVLSQTPVFQNSTEAFVARFTTASATEGGLEGTLVERYLGGMLAAFTGSREIPFWGYGAGMGSNVGSMLLTGSVQYLVAEGEWGRMAGEFGPMLGSLIIFLRLGFAWNLSVRSYRSMKRKDLLPWLLLGFTLLMLPQGSTAQPTSLGFLVMIAGLLLAALNSKMPAPAGTAAIR